MYKIRKLKPDIVSKIAAGEVIERPAYAVKELIENAVDAGSTTLRIDIEKSGLEKIIVTDNGEGMSKEDLLESFKPHTTSKIFSTSDLMNISTFGFRGEALSSIAAVSYVTIKTRHPESSLGNKIEIENGKIVQSSSLGMPKGTSIVIESLFNSVPARKKFLKSSAKEFRFILQTISQLALAFPNIRFFVTHNKKTVLDLPQNEPIEQRIKTLFGEIIYENIVPVKRQDRHIEVKGFISKPQHAQTTTQKQFIFINGRPVKSKIISQVVREVYGTLLSPQHYPVFFLFISLPFDMVDVNVHPRKEEVSFHNEQLITETVAKAVEEALFKNNLTFQDRRWQKTIYKPLIEKQFVMRDGSTNSYAANVLKDEPLPWELSKKTSITKVLSVSQIHNLYLVLETTTGFFIIDQHAAHERILYEQFEDLFSAKKTKVFLLKEPLKLALSAVDKEVIKEHIQDLKKMGFSIEEKRKQFFVYSVPELLKDRDFQTLIVEIIATVMEEKELSSTTSFAQKMLAFLACRRAVKSGDQLSKKQCEELVKQLENVKNPYTCPHGRPLKLEINLKELSKVFKRS